LVLAMASTGLWQWVHPSAINELWEPVLATRRPITFCIPTGQRRGSQIAAAAGILASHPATPMAHGIAGLGMGGAPAASFLEHENDGENVTFSDALAMLKMSDWVAAHGRESRVRADTSTTLYDLQQGPTILIGGLDNEWTLRALNRLRYRFSGSDHEQFWITDSKNPAQRDWVLVSGRSGAVGSAATADWAGVSRPRLRGGARHRCGERDTWLGEDIGGGGLVGSKDLGRVGEIPKAKGGNEQ
jgi:hypothetical protein